MDFNKIEQRDQEFFQGYICKCFIVIGLGVLQEFLIFVVVNQICEEIRVYFDFCEILDKLEIIISFLKFVKGDLNMFLEKFMIQIFKMENFFFS